jgi:FKBP-type peptidyl-prolyl cis-trans isomerase FklB
MKTNLITVALASLTLLLGACAKNPAKSKATPATTNTEPAFRLQNEKDSISYAIGVSIAGSLKNQRMDTLVNLDIIQRAFATTFKGDTALLSEMESNQYIQQYFQGLQGRLAAANKKAGEKFLAENKTKEGVKTTASGLQYLVLKEGTGAQPKASDQVSVHYVGTTLEGKEFDSSIKRGEPATFGVGEVIGGWTEALQLMKVGSKYKLFIPSELAYRETGNPPVIQPNSVLIFEVELLSIEKPGRK